MIRGQGLMPLNRVNRARVLFEPGSRSRIYWLEPREPGEPGYLDGPCAREFHAHMRLSHSSPHADDLAQDDGFPGSPGSSQYLRGFCRSPYSVQRRFDPVQRAVFERPATDRTSRACSFHTCLSGEWRHLLFAVLVNLGPVPFGDIHHGQELGPMVLQRLEKPPSRLAVRLVVGD